MPYNSLADVVRLLAEWYDTKSNVKLSGFRSQLQVSYDSSHTEELWYYETVCLWMTLYIYISEYIYVLYIYIWIYTYVYKYICLLDKNDVK